MRASNRWAVLCGWVFAGAVGPLLAQSGMPPAPVRYTEVIERAVRGEVILPGTVAARTSSVVASEVEGLVVELLAREGETIRKGAPIARLRRQTLELRLAEARAALKEAAARLELAVRSLSRSRELSDSGLISQQQFDDAISESDAWEGRVDQSRAEIARLEDNLERSRIPAPFTGVVVREHVAVGEWIDVGGAVVEMVSLADIEVVCMVPGSYLRAIALGSEVRVSFEALPDLEVVGKVSAIIPRADPQARTFPVKARIQNPEGQIGVGMLARVVFVAGVERSALMVPKDAVIRRGSTERVYVIDSEDTAQAIAVTTGEGLGEWIAVEGNLRTGQRVIVRGNERLRPGQKVVGSVQEYELP